MISTLTIFVSVIVLGSLIACLWLIWATSKHTPGEVEEGAVKDHTWDGDLREYNNPMPRWWLYLFLLTIAFALGYFVAYPSLGGYGGELGWSSRGEMEARLEELHSRRLALLARFEGQEIPDLASNRDALRVGESIYGNACAGCHGSQAHGAVGYPKLSDTDWNYGGAPEMILASITNGRSGVMPPFNGALDQEQLELLVATVQDWPEDTEDAGRQLFAQRCAACHGQEGHGNKALGAPNLKDDIWLWGGDRESIRHSILWGRRNAMPAHKDLLSEDEIRLVGAYVFSLSASDAASTSSP